MSICGALSLIIDNISKNYDYFKKTKNDTNSTKKDKIYYIELSNWSELF